MAAIEMPLGPFLTIVVQTHSPADGGVGNDTVVGGALWQNAESEPLPCTAAKLREAQCWESHNQKKTHTSGQHMSMYNRTRSTHSPRDRRN
jgi:hypothetical protein